jgi:EAL domain-containing protein (putative c-di-GMP-specific phosphodiesterase class I)
MTGLPERAARRLQIEGDLHRALDAGQFVLFWQPKIALSTGRIVSAEALLRWAHPERGLILPAEFISITEELELINRIGEWVLADAIRQRSEWEVEHGDEAPWSIAVNVSALQLSGPKAVDAVARVLSRWQWPPDRLVLELTESVLMDEMGEAHAMLDRFKELGVKLAIDDFGTGYSSLSYLHRFPVDQVKLDRSFVANIDADGEGSPIARAVINMAHALDITVTAEGVETHDQLRGLRRLECDRAQGFLLARPMPADEFSALLRTKPLPDHVLAKTQPPSGGRSRNRARASRPTGVRISDRPRRQARRRRRSGPVRSYPADGRGSAGQRRQPQPQLVLPAGALRFALRARGDQSRAVLPSTPRSRPPVRAGW